jgi:predicted nucleotidyltransferase
MRPHEKDADEISSLAATLRPVFQKHGISKAIVFGSFARGEPSRRSDVDLVLIQATEKRFLDRYEGILHDIITLVHGRDVDLLIYTPQEFAEMADRRFIQAIMKEGVVIYESNE